MKVAGWPARDGMFAVEELPPGPWQDSHSAALSGGAARQ